MYRFQLAPDRVGRQYLRERTVGRRALRYHEAHVRYGTTRRPNLHYCEWIRGWTDTCLKIYAELAVRNPDYLKQFDDEEVELEASAVH